MPPTKVRPDGQVAACYTVTDNLPSGATQAGQAQTLQDDFNLDRSALARILDATGAKRFYDSVPQAADGVPRGLAQLVQRQYQMEQMPANTETLVLANVTVPAGQNYVVLSVANGQAPAVAAAVSTTKFGTIVAKSTNSGSQFSSFELSTVSGPDSLSPENMCTLARADNGEVVQDGQSDVYGLLVAESTTTDGASFDDTSGGNRVKLCLVVEDFASKTLKAASAANVAGAVFNYRFVIRRRWMDLPPGAFTGRGIFRQMLGNVDITESRAVANQAGQPVQVPAALLYRLAQGVAFKVQNTDGSADLLAVTNNSSGTQLAVNVASAAVNTTSPTTFTQGIIAAGSSGAVNLGVTAGQIDAVGLTIKSVGSQPLTIQSTGTIVAKDAYIGASTWTNPALVLASSAGDYNTAKSLFGETSLLQMIIAASQHANHRNVPAQVVGTIIPAGTLMTGSGANANLNAQLPDYSKVARPSEDIILKRNGVELSYGPNAASGADWWPGGDATKGEFYIGVPLYGLATGHADEIKMELFGSVG